MPSTSKSKVVNYTISKVVKIIGDLQSELLIHLLL